MPRPCKSSHTELQPLTCRVCHWCVDDSPTGRSYRALWGEPEPHPDRPLGPCKHLTGFTGEKRDCKSCNTSAGPKAEVFSCAKHGPCTLMKSFADLACCNVCDDREPARDEFWPGLIDPLGGPELARRPRGWACRDEVKAAHMEALKRVAGMDPSDFRGPLAGGEGIVIVGGGKYWPMIKAAVRMAGKHAPHLPVAVFHRGGEEPVDDSFMGERVRYFDLTAVRPRPRILRGWETKTLALMHCSFDRALYLDADAYLVGDPSPLFDMAANQGFVSWGDMTHNHEFVGWDWLGIDPKVGQAVPSVQGGQLCIDLVKAHRLLLIAHWMGQHSDYFYHHPHERPKEWHCYGDQDCWRAALALTGAGQCHLGPATWEHPAFVCRVGGEPAVVHRCRGKAWADKWEETSHLPGDGEFWEFFREGL